MAKIVTKNLRLFIAEKVKEALAATTNDKVYFFIAKQDAWPTESSPPTPVASDQTVDYDIWKKAIAAKKVLAADITYSLPRYTWTSNTAYTEYNNTKNIYGTNFYVINSQLQVYKCMFNNNGAVSTAEPTGTSTSTITTSDGYKWKYMYTVSASDALKWLTVNYMPVSVLTSDDGTTQWDVQIAASNGSIEIYDILTAGSGYTDTHSGTVVTSNSSVTTLENGASTTDNLYNDSTIYISGGTGAGQLRAIVNYSGVSRQVTVNTAFITTPDATSTYIISPKVTVNGDGTGALAYSLTNSNGGIDSITSIALGTNYSFANVVISANNGTGATANAYLSPYGGHGANAISELGGYNLMMNVRLSGSESNNFTVANDYRTFGLVKNPQLANGTFANGTLYELSTNLTVANASGTFTADELVTGQTSNASGILVDFTSNNTLIRLTDVSGTFVNNEVVIGNTSSQSANITNINTSELLKHSGEVMYIENTGAIDRATDQIENFKIIFNF